jgi:anti-sigma B factor antagonist
MTNGEIGAASQGAPVALQIDGEMTIYRAAELKDVLSGAVQSAVAEARALALDLSGVTEFDSAGIQLLLVARREAERQGGALRLVALSPAVREVFALTGLSARFEGVQP